MLVNAERYLRLTNANHGWTARHYPCSRQGGSEESSVIREVLVLFGVVKGRAARNNLPRQVRNGKSQQSKLDGEEFGVERKDQPLVE